MDFGTQFAGQAVQIRFRIGNDDFGHAFGWVIDDIVVRGITNTPFPGFTAETEVCRGGSAARVDTSVTAIHHARSTSFDGVALP